MPSSPQRLDLLEAGDSFDAHDWMLRRLMYDELLAEIQETKKHNDQLQQVCDERLRVIEALDQAARERLELINKLDALLNRSRKR